MGPQLVIESSCVPVSAPQYFHVGLPVAARTAAWGLTPISSDLLSQMLRFEIWKPWHEVFRALSSPMAPDFAADSNTGGIYT